MKRSTSGRLAAELFRATPERRLTLLKAAWPVAVRPELARRSEVVALDGDTLRIRVPDAIWRRSLWRMRGDLLARLRDIAGFAAPRALAFVEGPVAAPVEPRTARSPAVTEAALSPVVARAAELIADDDTRERFRKAAGRYLARFAGQTTPGADDDSA